VRERDGRFETFWRTALFRAAPTVLFGVILVGAVSLILEEVVTVESASAGGYVEYFIEHGEANLRGTFGTLVMALSALSSVTSAARRRFRLAWLFLVLGTAVFVFRSVFNVMVIPIETRSPGTFEGRVAEPGVGPAVERTVLKGSPAKAAGRPANRPLSGRLASVRPV
jgi:hypothetical protein